MVGEVAEVNVEQRLDDGVEHGRVVLACPFGKVAYAFTEMPASKATSGKLKRVEYVGIERLE